MGVGLINSMISWGNKTIYNYGTLLHMTGGTEEVMGEMAGTTCGGPHVGIIPSIVMRSC